MADKLENTGTSSIQRADSAAGLKADDAVALGSVISRPLAQLLDYMAQQAPHKYVGGVLNKNWPSEPPETDYFQKTWARLGTGSQLKQSQRQVPDNAGPLNSNHLIHRALVLMQEQSPGYLQHFLTYVDTLAWMEQLDTPTAPPVKTPSRAKSTKKTARKTR